MITPMIELDPYMAEAGTVQDCTPGQEFVATTFGPDALHTRLGLN